MKLDPQHKHIMKLVQRDRDSEGWARVSNALLLNLIKNMPKELITVEETKDGGRAKLTTEGQNVLDAMDWL